MNFRIADTFTDSLVRLFGGEEASARFARAGVRCELLVPRHRAVMLTRVMEKLDWNELHRIEAKRQVKTPMGDHRND